MRRWTLGLALLLMASSAEAYGGRGWRGVPDATTPASKWTISADYVDLSHPSDGTTLVTRPLAAVTCDLNVVGRGGRDQSDALPAAGFVRFYVTRSATSSAACLASQALPSVGPTLQGGDTHWAYVATIRRTSNALAPMYLFGADLRYKSFQNYLCNGSATTWTEVDLSADVPPEALTWDGMRSLNVTTLPPTDPYKGAMVYDMWAGYVPADAGGVRYYHSGSTMVINALTPYSEQQIEGLTLKMPNVNQKFYYEWGVYAGSGQRLCVDAYGYRVPNGGE